MVDWLNIMAYDGGSPHANYDWAIAAANGWKARGLPASKTVLGVPFYSRPGGIAYSQIVAMNANNANVDCVTISGAQQYCNGLPTIRARPSGPWPTAAASPTGSCRRTPPVARRW